MFRLCSGYVPIGSNIVYLGFFDGYYEILSRGCGNCLGQQAPTVPKFSCVVFSPWPPICLLIENVAVVARVVGMFYSPGGNVIFNLFL